MKLYLRIFGAALLAVFVGGLLYGATYTQFSPGGALSGTWNSQNVNVGAGGALITGTLPVGNGGTGATAIGSTGQLLGNVAGVVGGTNMSTSTDTLLVGSGANGTVTGDTAATVTSQGRTILLRGGGGGATSGTGGTTQLAGGIPVDGNGGAISILGAAGVGTSRAGGAIQLTAGAASATNANGGLISMTSGAGAGSNNGGNLSGTAGAGGATGNGGQIVFTAGGGGATSGTGGGVSLTAGVPVEGDGGAIAFTARNGVGTNRNGGNITLIAGTATGSGTAGSLIFTNLTTTGSSTATFTATNKPGASTGVTPALWLRVSVGGTTYWMPLWIN